MAYNPAEYYGKSQQVIKEQTVAKPATIVVSNEMPHIMQSTKRGRMMIRQEHRQTRQTII